MSRLISIRNRIIRLVMAVSALIILITALLFALLSVSVVKEVQKQSILSGMGFAAEHCVPPLLFDDPDGAVQVLKNYSAQPQVEQAVLINDSGAVFAVYNPHGHAIIPLPPRIIPFAISHAGKLHLAVPVISDGEQIGILSTVVSLKEERAMLLFILLVIVLMIPMLMTLAYLFARRLQQRISGPILALARVAEEFRYGGAVPSLETFGAGTVEVSSLTNRFQEMLARIEAGKQELSEASSFLHSIVDSMPSLLIVADHSLTITLCNRAALRVSEKPDPIGHNLFDSFPFMADFSRDVQTLFRDKKRVVHRTKPIDAGALSLVDMELFPLQAASHPGIAVTITDVTELAQKDQQLIQIQKMETVGTLAGGLAHDFNNILSGIIGTLSLMEYRPGDVVNVEELNDYIAVMTHAGERAREMIDHLLSLSHKSDVAYGQVNLQEVIRHVIRFCEHSFDRKIRITYHVTTTATTILGSTTQLEQVLLNLCVNAAHAMTIMRPRDEEPGGELTITLNHQTIDELVLTVEDTGVGIPEAQIRQIFDPFFTTKEKGQGTGLGLSMVANIVSQHGGTITVDSTPGMGTKFTLLFPQITENKEPIKTESWADNQTFGKGRSILIIDDDSQIRAVAGKMVERIGFAPIFAEDGLEGIDLFSQLHDTLSLVLLDMVMPGLSGKEVYLRLREIDNEIPVILSSGFGQDERVLDTLNLGVADFVHKPYTIQELRSAFHRVLLE